MHTTFPQLALIEAIIDQMDVMLLLLRLQRQATVVEIMEDLGMAGDGCSVMI